ncbi:NAD-dependent epimerase/dehydratase family protein [Eubacterium ruminantium]|uniref:NAD-dependent epimerase/dehydratase family protein n=1 Tax=Eubacterium ruminantium TaxID=42322 RepID=UPI00156A29E0|nr:NAD(P)-dependent oxidoreductase [Eubacterium ruminantium]
MKIVLTGATGMIGLAIARMGIEKKHEIICLINPGSSRKEHIEKMENVRIIECSVNEYDSLETDIKADIFIHLAWEKTFGASRDDAEVQFRNIGHTISAAKLAKRMGCRMFIGAGSQAEYGPSEVDLTTSLKVNPESGYGISKFAAGKLAAIYCKQNDIRFAWVRILSIFGPGDGKNTLISYLINEFMEGRQPKLTKCEQIWDYLYCDDAAEAILSLAESDVDGKIYPLGSGNGRRLSEYVCDIRDIIDPSLEPLFGEIPYYPHQPMHLVADISEITADTGWKPKTDFKEGIRKTVEALKAEQS